MQVWKNTSHPLCTPLHTIINTSSNPPLSHTCNSDQRRRGAPGLLEAKKGKSTRPRPYYTSLDEILCWPAGLHLHKDLQQITGTAGSPLMLQTLLHHPIPRKSKITWLNDYRPVALTSVVMKSFEKLVLAHMKDINGPSLDPLQFAHRANRSVDDAVNMGLYYVLQHLDRPGAYVRIMFVDFSPAFSTIIPSLLLPKLTQLSVPTSIYQWINSFLTDTQQVMRLGKYTSSTRTISTGAPQGCVLSTLLFSMYKNDCTSKDPSVKLLKFADDTTLIGLIQDDDESAYRQEVKKLDVWCSLNAVNMVQTGFQRAKKSHVTHLFISLHWLPVAARIKFKTLMFAYRTCVPVAQWLEHCVSSAKVVGSIPREHIYWQYI